MDNLPDVILPLVEKENPILREEMPLFDFDNPPYDPVELEQFLAKHLVHYRGLGLSAPQLGLKLNCFVLGDPNDSASVCGVYNPEITYYSEDEQEYLKEGCLTFPDLVIQIKRPVEIRIKYQDCKGQFHEEKYRGLTSRIIQHEVDHLNGILFTSLATRYHLNRGKKSAQVARKMKRLNLKVVDGGKKEKCQSSNLLR